MRGRLCGWPHLPPCLRCRRLPAAAHASSPDCPRSWHHPVEGREESAKPWSAQRGPGFPAKWLACPCPAGARPKPSPCLWDVQENKRETYTPWKQKWGRDPRKSKTIQTSRAPLHLPRAKFGPWHPCFVVFTHPPHPPQAYNLLSRLKASSTLPGRAAWSANPDHPKLQGLAGKARQDEGAGTHVVKEERDKGDRRWWQQRQYLFSVSMKCDVFKVIFLGAPLPTSFSLPHAPAHTTQGSCVLKGLSPSPLPPHRRDEFSSRFPKFYIMVGKPFDHHGVLES